MILPRHDIARSTSFIVEDEAWYVVEYDHTSVPGVMYVSLTEEKINYIYDDVENNIADTHLLARYEVLTSDNIQNFNIGEIVNPIFTITKNGYPYSAETILIPEDKSIIDKNLIAKNVGQTTLKIQLKDFPEIEKSIIVNVSNEDEFNAYIEGDGKIKLGRSAIYNFIANKEVENVIFTIEGALASIVETKDCQCVVRANDKNQLGEAVLIAEHNGIIYKKKIKIVPLW